MQRSRGKADGGQRPGGLAIGFRVVAEFERRGKGEKLSIRSDPVGQGRQPRDEMIQPWLVGQRRHFGSEGNAEPSMQSVGHHARFVAPVIMRHFFPRAGRWIRRRGDRTAVVREDRVEQRLHGVAPLDDLPYRRVERMVAPAAGEYQECAALLDVSEEGSAPQTRRPPLGLEAGMELADVVQKHQRGQSLARQRRQSRAG